MLIAVMLFSETTVAKLAGHAITPEEVRQVNDGDRIVIGNPRPRVAGSTATHAVAGVSHDLMISSIFCGSTG